MKFTLVSTLFLLASPISVLAAIGDSCSHSWGKGTCKKSSDCGTSGFTVSGACPNDPSSVLCCIKKSCSPPAGTGYCENTSAGCSGGSFYSGYCPGDSSIKCCVKSTSGGGGTGSGAGILAKAKTQTGLPYVWGGGGCSGPSGGGFDCSGLTQYAICQWSKANGKQITIPRVSRDQYHYGTRVAVANRKVGDLVFYGSPDCNTRSNIYHVAIFAGDGKMFEAQKTGTKLGLYTFRTANLCPYAVRHW
ncbi:hypothetical protein EX30DRAFT_352198 [Ascodesmis nigricans]|uniref:NlpC/P60 domain-containing protein n=1 Tax=Ascodesmis nigricans TaxID=341454 RepID=A0A4S2MJJ4_9PEZI|nr:hypothetical protein EX30DRAFT_352198 [Ascodesmis nigricans]